MRIEYYNAEEWVLFTRCTCLYNNNIDFKISPSDNYILSNIIKDYVLCAIDFTLFYTMERLGNLRI